MDVPIILYEYRPSRGGEHPRNFLAGFKGYLHVDGYSGYHKVSGAIVGHMRAACSTMRSRQCHRRQRRAIPSLNKA
ncbi:hypothetical protein Back11_17620 [Paenibacillus baekrokdamisoli]|uniref:Transposase IS66 central domain-containing protein n=1 Tax=Paenibacillus baekrokdamisoli TaxID=1712516 RepID=A0A3G9ING3_9BACL|nr:transposase [Paenibacillus baekrokdamisoli]BBH20417.1 hypothetical protein Back11_17620 [Paenibacillus baekrokdamisoli]